MASATVHMARRRKHLRQAKRARKRGGNKVARRHLHAARVELRRARTARKRARAPRGPSGLSGAHRVDARRRARQAALLGMNHRGVIHYTQSGARWQGINSRRLAAKGQYPNWADCSSFTTWCIWNAVKVPYGVRDVVNGAGWAYGYTGTQLNHGVRVTGPMEWGDMVHYHGHVAIYVGGGMVVSHGSESGPLLIRWNYRPVISVRRYI